MPKVKWSKKVPKEPGSYYHRIIKWPRGDWDVATLNDEGDEWVFGIDGTGTLLSDDRFGPRVPPPGGGR